MAKKAANPAPEKPALGSIEMNKIIRAVNNNKPNPCTENDQQIRFYDNVKSEKEKTGAYFSLVEPDAYEDWALGNLL